MTGFLKFAAASCAVLFFATVFIAGPAIGADRHCARPRRLAAKPSTLQRLAAAVLAVRARRRGRHGAVLRRAQVI
jgi:hypothetical protein